jgi:hypothetical protein
LELVAQRRSGVIAERWRDVVLTEDARLPVLLKLVVGTTEKADMPLKIGTGEKTRREWFLRTLFCWFLIVAIFAAIKFL